MYADKFSWSKGSKGIAVAGNTQVTKEVRIGEPTCNGWNDVSAIHFVCDFLQSSNNGVSVRLTAGCEAHNFFDTDVPVVNNASELLQKCFWVLVRQQAAIHLRMRFSRHDVDF